VSVIPIILLAIYTRSFIINKNEANLKNQIISDLNLVTENLKGKPIDINAFQSKDTLNVLHKDILGKSFIDSDKNFNLFVKNNLIATTNEELYKSDLLDTRIDADAFYNIVYLKKDLFIKSQNIGGFSFLVGFKPFKNENKSIIGFISSQSVYKQNELNEELTETLTFIFGIYFIVIIVLLILVSFFTERISKPILELQEATLKLSKGQSNIEIKTKRSDEMGALVESFNKMTKDLEKSKRELKKAEREAAWRDIARRVAHEIKNPLTPMKLSIQHLYEIYKEKKGKNFDAILAKTKDLIYSEVDKLNRIATEFSDFAKLPGRDYRPINVNNILEDVISLYSIDPKVKFEKSLQKQMDKIYGDREELNRAFQNLIKNAIQALDSSGQVEIKSYQKDRFIFVEINDNGSGMEPEVLNKLFEPNFSTKTRGMGLGLAITKKSLDDMKARISFTSELNVGTKVTIRFKVFENKTKKKIS
jgi:nitrogen fixation/metabolism regulation signal transduction histidine kinase